MLRLILLTVFVWLLAALSCSSNSLETVCRVMVADDGFGN
jgi:hypothetical protein